MTDDDALQYVIFSVEGVRYGIEIALVREIVPLGRVERVPRSLRCMDGMMDLRGHPLPVLSMREILGVGGRPDQARNVIVSDVGPALVGLSVDGAHSVRSIQAIDISIDPPAVPGLRPQYVVGALSDTQGIIVLLDVARAFTPGELELLEAGMADGD